MTHSAMNTNEAHAPQASDRSARGYTATRLGGAALDAAAKGWKLILETSEAGAARHNGCQPESVVFNPRPTADTGRTNP